MSAPEDIRFDFAVAPVRAPGTPDAGLEAYIALGFNRFVIHAATVGIPRPVHHQILSPLAAEVAPRFSAAFADKSAA